MSEATTTNDTELLESLAAVFMEHGFGGASLTLFTQATGLKRPSLYHRFPGGKLDIALAVAKHGQEHFFGEVLRPLTQVDKDPRVRVEEAAQNMGRFYDAGNTSCLMDALVLGAKGEDREVLETFASEMLRRFLGAFTEAAVALGATDRAAVVLGEEAVVRLEGSLVLARGTGNDAAFRRALKDLPDLLEGHPPERRITKAPTKRKHHD